MAVEAHREKVGTVPTFQAHPPRRPVLDTGLGFLPPRKAKPRVKHGATIKDNAMSALCPRMRIQIFIQKHSGIDGGIDLRRRKAGVTE